MFADKDEYSDDLLPEYKVQDWLDYGLPSDLCRFVPFQSLLKCFLRFEPFQNFPVEWVENCSFFDLILDEIGAKRLQKGAQIKGHSPYIKPQRKHISREMEAKATFQEKNIGGIKVYYSKGNTKNALFLLHGRKGSALEFIEKYIQMINVLASLAHVFVIDQRNHGERLLDPVQNRGKDANVSHPIDMYAIQLGTAMDLCYLVDAIPLYVPELALDATFAVLGYSLGGHASLLALSHCEKLSICVSVVGCADYLKLMESRDCEIGSALFNLVERKDPINNLKSIVNKHIHLLGGEQDHLVPRTLIEVSRN